MGGQGPGASAPASVHFLRQGRAGRCQGHEPCLLYTSDAADERSSVDLGGSRIIKKKNNTKKKHTQTMHQKTAHTTVTSQ